MRCHAQKVRKDLLSRRFWSRLVVVRLGDTTTTLERPREKRFDVQSFDHKTTRDRDAKKLDSKKEEKLQIEQRAVLPPR